MNHNKISTFNLKLFLCLFLCIPSLCQSLDSDNKQPITLIAHTVTYHRNTHVGVYTGNVQITQGTTHILANQITTYGDSQNKIQRAVAIGTPAQYQTVLKAGQPIFYANANTIQFFPTKQYVVLLGNVKIIQGKNMLTGQQVKYHIKTGNMISQPHQNGRTTIIFQPHDLPKIQTEKSKS